MVKTWEQKNKDCRAKNSASAIFFFQRLFVHYRLFTLPDRNRRVLELESRNVRARGCFGQGSILQFLSAVRSDSFRCYSFVIIVNVNSYLYLFAWNLWINRCSFLHDFFAIFFLHDVICTAKYLFFLIIGKYVAYCLHPK